MNKGHLKHRLNIDQAELASVSDDLHRRVMRAVAEAPAVHRSRWAFRFTPALAAGALATAVAVMIWSNIGPTPAPTAALVDESQAGIDKINLRIAALGDEVRLPEAALREELQRLESDLKRFRLSS